MIYWINKLVLLVANPLTIGIVLMVIGFVSVARPIRGRKRPIILLIGFLWFAIWSMGVTQRILSWCLGTGEYEANPLEELPNADYIVDLGGGLSYSSDVSSYPILSPAADRAWHAARLIKSGKAPFLITSGVGTKNADAVFLAELGVPKEKILIENESRNTEENAINTAKMIEWHQNGKGDASVLLVTSVSHMQRALMIFKKKAPRLKCIPVATDFGSVNCRIPFGAADFLPSVGAFVGNLVVYKECLGVIGYKLRGF